MKTLASERAPKADRPPGRPVRTRRPRRLSRFDRHLTGRRSAFRVALGLLALVVLVVGWSYVHALMRPSTDALSVRSVEWVRDHGGQGFVAWVEREWYAHHQPPTGGIPKNLPSVASPTPPRPGTTLPRVVYDTPNAVHLLVTDPVAGEGQWQPAGRTPNGSPVLYTTFMRPDDVHTSLVTGLAWLDTKRVRMELWSGQEEPGGGGWTLEAPIPAGVRPELIAAFNSGFKLSDSRGGYYAEGRMVRPLVEGKASMVFHANGDFTVAQWGRDAVLAPDIVGVRQNLVLLVDGGKPAPELDKDSLARWGFTPGNNTLVWRSGVGVDAAGHAIYAAGNGLSVASLANVLVAAGAVRAMELDINSTWVDFYSYHDDPSAAANTVPLKLLADMRPPLEKYFSPSSRDFVAVFTRRHP